MSGNSVSPYNLDYGSDDGADNEHDARNRQARRKVPAT
jgi:hypothetical protein